MCGAGVRPALWRRRRGTEKVTPSATSLTSSGTWKWTSSKHIWLLGELAVPPTNSASTSFPCLSPHELAGNEPAGGTRVRWSPTTRKGACPGYHNQRTRWHCHARSMHGSNARLLAGRTGSASSEPEAPARDQRSPQSPKRQRGTSAPLRARSASAGPAFPSEPEALARDQRSPQSPKR